MIYLQKSFAGGHFEDEGLFEVEFYNMKFIIKLIVIIFVIILIAEGFLQLLSRAFNPHGSYPEFFEDIKVSIASADVASTIFFVGDSTIYGGGASDEELYSLPSQFQNIIFRAGSEFKVLNLGYPGTNGKEHLEVLRLLPDKAKVVMRTGINDSWRRHDSFKLNLFGKYFELRTLKLAMIIWHGWTRNSETDSATSGYNIELQRLTQSKSFDLYFVDYFLGEQTFMNTFFEDKPTFIPLAKILIQKGFGDSNGRISKRFLSYDLVHANDLGYQLQAQAIYNWFVEKGKWGFDPNSKFALAVDEGSLLNLKNTLQKWLLKLKQLHLDSADSFPLAMKAAWQYYVATGDSSAKDIFDALARVHTYAFHSIYPITLQMNRLNRFDLSKIETIDDSKYSHAKLNQWFQFIQIFRFKSSYDYVPEYLDKFPKILKVEEHYSNFEGIETPHPLEFCPRFLKETRVDVSEISILKDWKFLYGRDFDRADIPEVNSKICDYNIDQGDQPN